MENLHFKSELEKKGTTWQIWKLRKTVWQQLIGNLDVYEIETEETTVGGRRNSLSSKPQLSVF